MGSNARLVGQYFENLMCEHCHTIHECQVEVWSWHGVCLTRYAPNCQDHPVYGFAY
jgi:hypothetical protein